MTTQERRHPEIINGSRRQRIAQGSGRSIAEVNRLVKQFSEMQKMMKKMGGGSKKGKKRMSPLAGLGAGGFPGMPGGAPEGFPGGGFPGFPPSR